MPRDKRDKRVFVDTYAHNWGFLLPCKSGVVWEQQVEGVSCGHIQMEGVFFPLDYPVLMIPVDKKEYDWSTGIRSIITKKLLPLHGRRQNPWSRWEIYEPGKYWKSVNLLDVLASYNYAHYPNRPTKTGLTGNDIWKLIHEEMQWEYKELSEGPEEYAQYFYVPKRDRTPWLGNCEGWQWIKPKKLNRNKDLIGRTLVLIYPNSD